MRGNAEERAEKTKSRGCAMPKAAVGIAEGRARPLIARCKGERGEPDVRGDEQCQTHCAATRRNTAVHLTTAQGIPEGGNDACRRARKRD